jgi:signal transduction histidine kinase
MYKINLYAIPNIIGATFCIIIGLFVFLKNKRSEVNKSFLFLALSSFAWQIGTALVLLSDTPSLALFWSRRTYLGSLFIPITTYHFVTAFLHNKNRKLFVILSYLIGIFIFLPLSQTSYFFSGVYTYPWGYWFKVNFLHPAFLLFATILIALTFYDLYKGYKTESSPAERLRKRYLFVSFIVAYFGAVDYIPNYGIKIYPFGYFPLIIYIFSLAYAIVRHRLMDIRVAITRTGVFIAVYTLVLGLPFAMAVWLKGWLVEILGAQWWMGPFGSLAFLATMGPFIYIYFQRRAEARLLREQRRYQETLKQASVGMTRIRNLRKLLDLITHIVTKTVHISYAAIYLYNNETDEYVLQVSRDKGRISLPKLSSDNPLILWISVKREPLVYEEVKRQMQDSNNVTFKLLEENMRLLTASVVIPSFLEDRFMGFIVLGDKVSGQIYTPDDLNVFEVLASQAALAIENAQFYEEAKEMQEQIAQAEKMATVGTMADGMSHQINNRFYALSLIAGDTIDTIKMTDTSKCTPEVKEMIDQINHALERIQTNVMQGGEVVKGILKYTRKGDEGFDSLTIDQVLDGTLEMVQYKVKLSEIDIIRDYPKDTPKIKGNAVQLQEVFFNFIDNAYDAIVERRTTLKEPNYRGRITVNAHPKDSNLEIIVEDNGMGVKDDDMKKIFTPFFTTKTSSRKGTGLGLYVIRRIIVDTHKGTINFESDHKVGTRFVVELPIAK